MLNNIKKKGIPNLNTKIIARFAFFEIIINKIIGELHIINTNNNFNILYKEKNEKDLLLFQLIINSSIILLFYFYHNHLPIHSYRSQYYYLFLIFSFYIYYQLNTKIILVLNTSQVKLKQ